MCRRSEPFSRRGSSCAGALPWLSRVGLAVAALAISFTMAARSGMTEPRVGFMEGDSVRFSVKTPARCMFGDFDLIRQDMMWADKGTRSKILLSLQTADGATEYAKEIFGEITNAGLSDDISGVRARLMEGHYEVALDVKRPATPQIFSLVVCKDSSGKGTCRQSSEDSFVPINKLFSAYMDPKSGFVSPDSVYFYQLLVVGPEGAALSEKPIFDEQALNDFAVASKAPVGGVTTLVSRVKTLESYPLEPSANSILIQLPILDEAKCGQ